MKLVIQPIHLVGREALHVFALPNHQLQVAAGESQSAAHIRGFMEDASPSSSSMRPTARRRGPPPQTPTPFSSASPRRAWMAC